MHAIARDTIVDGRYRAIKRLGAGGMAEVWCAEDEVLGRRVALKLLGGRFAEDPEFRERFRREAQAAAGLTHPNIVGIFDRSEWDGTPYIAMELVDGQTLKELVTERGPLPPDIAVGLTEQILRALGYAHRRGIVHRDVKPQNVILDPEGQAKVADFGIARAGNSEMTADGRDRRHRPVPLARAGRGPPGRPPLGPLLGRHRALRAADRPRAVRRRGADLDRAQAHQRAPGAARPAAARASRPRSRRSSCARWRRTRRGASRAPRSSSPRSRHARRAPTRPDRDGADAGRAVGRGRARARAGGCGLLVALVAGRDRRRRVLPARAARRSTCPNLVGRDASEAADILHKRGLEIAFVDVESDDVPRDEVISQDPEAGERGQEGSTVTAVDLRPARATAPVPDVEGQSEDDAEQALQDAGLQDQGRAGVLGHRARGRRDLDLARGRQAGDQGPHGHADGLQGRGGRRGAQAWSGYSSDDAEAQLDRPRA